MGSSLPENIEAAITELSNAAGALNEYDRASYAREEAAEANLVAAIQQALAQPPAITDEMVERGVWPFNLDHNADPEVVGERREQVRRILKAALNPRIEAFEGEAT